MDLMDNVNRVRASGQYPVVTLDIFEKAYDLKFSDFILEREETIKKSMYKKYLDSLYEMKPSRRKTFLKAIKAMEIRDNDSLEKEDSFFTELYNTSNRKGTIDILLKERRKFLSKNKFIEAHKTMLDGSFNQKCKNYYCRVDNSRFVGEFVNGERRIQYFPIDYRDIGKATEGILTMYNGNYYSEHLLLKPQIIHGLVAASQLFEDGNTRYSRILQNVMIYDYTNNNMAVWLESPAVYGTRSYFPFRGEYRRLIGELVKENSDEAWDNWFNFNLNRFEDSIWFLEEKKGQYEKILKR